MSGPQEADLRQSQLGLLRGEEHRGLHRARGDGAHVRCQVLQMFSNLILCVLVNNFYYGQRYFHFQSTFYIYFY